MVSMLGVESRFGHGIGRVDWLEDGDAWSLTGMDGQDDGQFTGVVASDKNMFSSRFTKTTGKPPPIGTYIISLYHSPSSSVCYQGFEVADWQDGSCMNCFCFSLQTGLS